MSGATRTVQQPAATGSLYTAVGLIALIAAVAFAVAVSVAGRATTQVSAPVSAPAPIYAPSVRDRGANDLPITNSSAGQVMPKVEPAPAPTSIGTTDQPLGYHGFGGPAPVLNPSGSNQAAPAAHRPGLRPS